jgi:hypothetical protein
MWDIGFWSSSKICQPAVLIFTVFINWFITIFKVWGCK